MVRPVQCIQTVPQLEDRLSEPSEADRSLLGRLSGDFLVLGAGGKMGPSLSRLVRRAAAATGVPRCVTAVSRFASIAVRAGLEAEGIKTIAADLLNRETVEKLPDCENVLYLAGRKFGSSGRPDLTWASNAMLPAWVAQRFVSSRIVVFSTGNVYAFRTVDCGGSRESDPPSPLGEYAQSCLARERIFEYFSREQGLRCVLFRLNYAVDLRYGVIADIARKVYANEPVDLTVPACNAIWQRDANSYALRALELCDSPPRILNVTGADVLSVRAAAEFFAARFGRACRFSSAEGRTALLSDPSLCHTLLGPPTVSTAELMEWVADWVACGGVSLDKPTHFEVADGSF